jgi:hypothetical protein
MGWVTRYARDRKEARKKAKEEEQQRVEVTGKGPRTGWPTWTPTWGDIKRAKVFTDNMGPPRTAQEERQRILERGAMTTEGLAAALSLLPLLPLFPEEIQEQERQREAKEAEEERALPRQEGAEHEEEEGAPEGEGAGTNVHDHQDEEGGGKTPE